MSSKPSKLTKLVSARLSDEDFSLLTAIIDHEKDTMTNVLRRLIRRRHKQIYSPGAKRLTLSIPDPSFK